MKRLFPAVIAAALAIAPAITARAAGSSTLNFQLVGSNALYNRGMNAAPAVYDHAMYIGSRTDGTHPHAGVLVVDIADPANPTIAGEIGAPDEALPSSTSRELRVWPQQKLLIVMNFQCSAILHACASPADANGSAISNFTFYDLSDELHPAKVATYKPSRTPHEMFLWVDPAHDGRALLYFTGPSSSVTNPNLLVADISKARQNVFTETVKWSANDQYTADERNNLDVRLHSIGVSIDGTRMYLAYLGGGFEVADTSDLAAGKADPKIRLITSVGNRIPAATQVGTHSSVKVPGRALVLTTDEVYGDSVDAVTGEDHGCPWGWVRLIDIADEAHPKLVGEYKMPQNYKTYCDGPDGQDKQNTYFTSYSAHNPTVIGDLAFVTWHSDGLQAISLTDPTHPVQVGQFMPETLPYVVTEDPSLSLGKAKVVAWSYPIIRSGLIYFVDIRNGLFVVRYTGPHADEVNAISFYEGNSNLGDAAHLEHPASVLSRRIERAPALASAARRPLPTTGAEDALWPALVLFAVAVALGWRVRRRGPA